MKKILTISLIMCIGFVVFAYDASPFLTPVGDAKSYTKTDYDVTTKFGDYFRTPSRKFTHIFDSKGTEVEAYEYSATGTLIDRVTFEYNSTGNLCAQVCYDSENNVVWKMVTTFDDKGKKIDDSSYEPNGVLTGKTIYKYTGADLTDESYYNGNGALTWKNIYKYNDRGLCIENASYFSDGTLNVRKTFKYNEAGSISEVDIYNADDTLSGKEVYRYDADNVLTEFATYTPDNAPLTREFFKYETNGNLSKTTTYAIYKKFGTVVNEIVDMSDYFYEY